MNHVWIVWLGGSWLRKVFSSPHAAIQYVEKELKENDDLVSENPYWTTYEDLKWGECLSISNYRITCHDVEVR